MTWTLCWFYLYQLELNVTIQSKLWDHFNIHPNLLFFGNQHRNLSLLVMFHPTVQNKLNKRLLSIMG